MKTLLKSLTRLTFLSLLLVIITSVISIRTFAQSGNTITTKSGDITASIEQKDYSPSDTPSIKISKQYSLGIKGIFQRSRKVLGVSTDTSLQIEVKDSQGELIETKQVPPTDSTLINIDKSSLPHPGIYTINITDPISGSTITQDFTWGVLAINTNKSIYLPGETANIALAVLDEKGAMVCDAEINLQITDPTGSISEISTTNKGIISQEACKTRSYTLEPDYKAIYQTTILGNYQIHLTATTTNGTYSISDSFKVQNSVSFDVERITATRLYPLNEYPVLFKITANQDYQGIVEEKLSSDLLAYYIDNSQELSSRFSLSANIENGLIETLPGKDDGNQKTLRWHVNWKQGQTYYLSYYFNPPNISPEFYTLGPLSIGAFQESRLWQLANDDTTTKTFVFASDAESFSFTSGGKATGTYDGSVGNPAGSLKTDSLGRNNADTSYWLWSGTWESLGVTAGSTVTQIRLNGVDSKVSAWNVVDAVTIGPYKLRDSSAIDQATLWAGRSPTGTEGSWVSTGAQSDQSVPSPIQASTSSIQLYLERSIDLGNNASAQATFNEDNIAFTITYTPPATGDAITGKVYTDDTESVALTSVSACVAINASHNIADCATTDGTGTFSITSTSSQTNSGDQLTFFLDGGTYFGNTVTIADGGDILSGDNLRIYQNHVLVRYEQGTSIGIADMDAYDNDQNATDLLFDAEDSTTDTLTVENGNEFYIPSGVTFTPTGNLDDGAGNGIDDIEIAGTYTSAASESILVSGSWLNSGTFTASTSTVKFDATAGTETINSSGATLASFNNLTIGVISGSATWNLSSALDVNGNLSIDYGTLSMNGSNNINIAGNLSIGANGNYTYSTGTLTFDGSGTSTWTNAATIDNLGTISINGSTKTINLGSSVAATSINVASGQTLGLASSGYTLEITGSGTAGSRPFIVTGTLNEGTSSTVKFTGSSATEIEPETYYNLSLSPAGTPTYTLGTTTSQTINITGDLTIGDGTNGVTVTAETYDPTLNIDNNFTISTGAIFQASSTGTFTIANNYTNSGTFTANTGSITFDAQDSGNTITGTLTGTSAFNTIIFDDSSTSGAWAFSNNLEVSGNFTITGGSVTGPSSGTMNLGGNFTNNDTFVHNSSSLTFDNSAGGTVTIDADGTGTDILNIVTFNDAGGGTTFQLTTPLTTAGNFTITGGTLAFNDQSIYIGGNYINNDTVSLGGISDSLTLTNAEGGTITFDPQGTGSSSLLNVTIDDTGGGTIFQLSSPLDVNGNLTISNGTLSTGTNYQINISGTFTNNDIFTANSGTVVMDGSSNSIAGTTNTNFHSLSISGTNTTITSSDPSVSNTLTISTSDTLTINSSRTLTIGASGSISLDSTGTITGSGMLIFQPASGFPTTGTISSIVEFDSTSNAQIIPARTYNSNIEFYNNSGLSRNYTLGTGTSQTINFNGNLTLNGNSGAITIDASIHNPIINIGGNLSFTSGGSIESITTGTSNWNVSGNVDFSNGSLTATTGNTLAMNGSSKTITSNSQSLYNFTSSGTISNTDTLTVSNNFTISGGTFSASSSIDTNGNFNITSGTFNHGSGSNVDINIAGDFTLTDGSNWTENTDPTSQVIFDGDLDYADNSTGAKQSLGNVVIGASPETTNLTTDFAATSLTVIAADFFNTCEYDLDIGTGGIDVNGTLDTSPTGSGVSPCSAGNEGDETFINTAEDFNLNSGSSFVQDQSTIIFDATSGTNTLITDGSFSLYNLEINSSAITEVQDPLDVDNNLTLTLGTLDVVTIENNQINVGGNWDNNGGTFIEQSGKVVLDGTTSTTLDSNCSDVSTCTNENFYDLEINKTDASDVNDNVTLTNTGIRVTNTITLTDGELIQGTLNTRAEGAIAISIASGSSWTNTSTGNLTLGGTLSNSGTVTFQGTTSACGEADAITITSTTTSQRSWNGTGTFNINDVDVSWMGGTASINAYSSTDSGNNDTNWNFANCPVNFSGFVYDFGTSSALTECDTDTGTYELRLRVAGTTQSASCDDITGAFTFSNIPGPSAGDGLIAWIDDAVVPGTDGAIVVRYDGTGASDNNIFYDNAVTITSDDTNPVDILDFDFFDSADDADIPYTATDSTPDTLVINSGYELLVKIKSGVAGGSPVLDPGGTITTNSTGGDLHIDDNSLAYLDTTTNSIGRDILVDGGATLYIDANTNISGGNITTSGTSATVSYSTGTPTLTISGTGSIGGGTTPTINFYNLSTSGTGTTSISSPTTINNNGTIGSATTLNINADLSIAGNLTNTTTGIINTTSGTPTTTFTGSATIGGGSGNITFYNLATTGTGTSTFSGSGTNNILGNITVGSGNTLNLNSSTTIAGNLTNITTGIISTSAGTPDITIQGSSIGGGSGNITFYDLSITGTTTLSNSGTNTVNNNLTVESGTFTQSSPITVTGDASVASGSTYNVNANLTINGGGFTTISTGIINTTSGTPTINITGTGNLGGGSGAITIYNLTVDGVSTITTASDFTVTNLLTIGDGTNAATLQVNTNDNALSTRHLTINNNAIYSASSNTSYPLTISDDFTNSGTFTANLGKVIFNNSSNTSTLSYSTNTTFANLEITTPSKPLQFDDTYITYVTTALTIQGSNCSTGRIFLDSETNDNQWEIDATGASVNIDYVDIEDSIALTTTLTADNSTTENNNNTNWTITEGVCGAKESRILNNIRMFSGTRAR